jgi:hypothetical protein
LVRARPDRTEATADDADHPAEGAAGHQREASAKLDHPEDDQDPAEGVEVGENEPLVVDENVRIIQGADPIDDVERAHNQQHGRREQNSARAPHPYLLALVSAALSRPYHADSNESKPPGAGR